jgi:hypothetical protein
MKLTLALVLVMISCAAHAKYQARKDGNVYACPRGTFTTVEHGRVYCNRMDNVSEDLLFGGGQ